MQNYNPEIDAVLCSECNATLVNPRIGICSNCQNELDRERKAAEMDYNNWVQACKRGHFDGSYREWCNR